VSEIPRELDDVVRRATTRDPQDRFVDGRAMHAALVDARDRLGLHGTVPAPPADDTINLARTAARSAVPDRNRTAALPPAAPPRGEREQREPRRWPFVVVAVVVLSLIAGVGGWWLAVGRYTHTPSVLHLTYSAAAAKLDKAGLHAHEGRPVYTDSVPRGQVAEQDPGANARVHRGATIDLRVSAGPAHVDVPDITGDKLPAATAALAKANLRVGNKTQVYSTTVQAGHVIKTNPAVGTQVDAGRDIDLTVSQGPQPVQMPDVTNKSYADAASILSGVGLKPTRQDVFSDSVPAGNVVTTLPAPSATAHQGQTVVVKVSKGPPLVRVPDVTGDSDTDATRILEVQGFHVEEHRLGGGPKQVLHQTPSAGSMVPRGSTVVIYVF
jgi:serine/threonine-protein kinase